MSRHPLRARDYLGHMLDAVGQIQAYTHGKSPEDFLSDRLLQDGVVRNIEILGEASRNLLTSVPDATEAFPDIPFAAIYAMRNQLAHGYFAIDLDVVWKVIARDLPGLRMNIEKALIALGHPPESTRTSTHSSCSRSTLSTKLLRFQADRIYPRATCARLHGSFGADQVFASGSIKAAIALYICQAVAQCSSIFRRSASSATNRKKSARPRSSSGPMFRSSAPCV